MAIQRHALDTLGKIPLQTRETTKDTQIQDPNHLPVMFPIQLPPQTQNAVVSKVSPRRSSTGERGDTVRTSLPITMHWTGLRRLSRHYETFMPLGLSCDITS